MLHGQLSWSIIDIGAVAPPTLHYWHMPGSKVSQDHGVMLAFGLLDNINAELFLQPKTPGQTLLNFHYTTLDMYV